MALIGNYSVIAKLPTTVVTGRYGMDRSNWNNTGQMRNWGAKENGTDWRLAAIPQGTGPLTGWLLPVVAGDMTAYSTATLTVSTLATGAMGFPIQGESSISFDASASILPEDDSPPARSASASFSFVVPDATGQLVSSGSGSASFSITANTPTLISPLYGVGSASVEISSSALLGAVASVTGESSIMFSGTGSILPVDDSSPARTAQASFLVSGTLSPYAIGHMSGTTVAGEVGLSPADINAVADASAERVWGFNV